MGFFSWNCAKSGISIANIHSGQLALQSQCYLITPNETIYEGAYDGYGVFGGKDVYELIGDGDRDKGIDDYFYGHPKFKIKVVLAKFYNNETYDELSESEECEFQGYFYPSEDDEKYDEDEEDY